MAVLVMADAPRPGTARPQLEPLLGGDGCARLQRALIARTARWAATSGEPYVAYAPADAREDVAVLVPARSRLFAQVEGHRGERLAAAFSRVCDEHAGPVVMVGTGHPTLAERHAWGARDDLREGVDVTLGPATAGGYYLLGAPRYHPALFAIDATAWGGPDVMSLTLRAVFDAGLSVGWLRSERELDTPGDVAALLADPCTPAEIREALGG